MATLDMNSIVYFKLNERGIRIYNQTQKFDSVSIPYDTDNKNGWIRDTLWSVFEIFGKFCGWGKDCMITVLETDKPEDY